jgi:hypothetical protein
MVGAAITVLLGGAAELADGHQQHAVRLALLRNRSVRPLLLAAVGYGEDQSSS